MERGVEFVSFSGGRFESRVKSGVEGTFWERSRGGVERGEGPVLDQRGRGGRRRARFIRRIRRVSRKPNWWQRSR